MKNRKLWLVLLATIVIAGASFYFRDNVLSLISGGSSATASAQTARGVGPANLTTTTIRPATDSARVSASGNIEVADQQAAVLQVDGIVSRVAVEVGDQVAVNDLLVALDTTDLERAAKQAELNLASSQAQLDKLREAAAPADVAAARASLASSQENLAEVKVGPSQAELAAAEANLAAAQDRYQELKAGSSQAELTQLGASFEKARIALQQAQWAYDKIAYTDSSGTSSQAADLQQATIDYDAAKAAYEIATEPPSEADLQDALSAIQTAQDQLDTLRAKPTPAELAAAESQLASAQAQLDQLLNGPSEADLRAAEISLEQAQLNLDEAQAALGQAQLRAPITGTVLAVDVEAGQRVSPGLSAVTLADLTALELTVNVAEVDIGKIQLGQNVEITIDALPDKVFSGVVARIAPISASESGVVNYPVTIQLTGPDLTGVRPGMTTVATILDQALAGSWLVPTTAVRERGGNTVVMILRNGQPTPISVTAQGSEGEWTIVKSPELQAGDAAVGQVSSFLNQGNASGGFRPPGGGFGGIGRPPD